MQGKIHIYYGDGKGKTTRATGLCIRCAGAGNRVAFAQFLKDGSSSELNILSQLGNVSCFAVKKNFGFTWTMTAAEIEEATEEYKNLFDNLCDRAKEFDMIVFDELLTLIQTGLGDESYIIDRIKNIQTKCEIVLTGHAVSDTFSEIADYVSNIVKIKHPYDKGEPARQGIEY